MPTVLENWNERARRYGYDAVGVIGTRDEVQEEQYRKTKRFLNRKIPKNNTILDYGCGVGRLSVLFKPKNYTGMDISPEMLKIAREKHPDYTFIQMTQLPKTDIFFTANVLQHNNDKVVKSLDIPAKELYLYEIVGKGEHKPHLYPRTIEDYEMLLGLKCKKSWKNGNHTLMYYVNNR